MDWQEHRAECACCQCLWISASFGRNKHTYGVCAHCCQECAKGCLVQVGNDIELEAVGLQFEPYW